MSNQAQVKMYASISNMREVCKSDVRKELIAAVDDYIEKRCRRRNSCLFIHDIRTKILNTHNFYAEQFFNENEKDKVLVTNESCVFTLSNQDLHTFELLCDDKLKSMGFELTATEYLAESESNLKLAGEKLIKAAEPLWGIPLSLIQGLPRHYYHDYIILLVRLVKSFSVE